MRAPSDPYLFGLNAGFQGEVFGIAMYLRIADARQDPSERDRWLTLVELERTTFSVLTPVIARHGLSVQPEEQSRIDGYAEAADYLELPWRALMQRFSTELDVDITEYSRLLDICPEPDLRAVRFLVDHEHVTKAFCDLELSGQTRVSLDPVHDLIASVDKTSF